MKLLAESRINENTFEHFSQALLLLIITALKFSNTKTVGCLESMIVKDDTFILVISACWSIISITLGLPSIGGNDKRKFLTHPWKTYPVHLCFLLLHCKALWYHCFFYTFFGTNECFDALENGKFKDKFNIF